MYGRAMVTASVVVGLLTADCAGYASSICAARNAQGSCMRWEEQAEPAAMRATRKDLDEYLRKTEADDFATYSAKRPPTP